MTVIEDALLSVDAEATHHVCRQLERYLKEMAARRSKRPHNQRYPLPVVENEVATAVHLMYTRQGGWVYGFQQAAVFLRSCMQGDADPVTIRARARLEVLEKNYATMCRFHANRLPVVYRALCAFQDDRDR